MKRRSWLVRSLPWITTLAIITLQEILARTGVLPNVIPPFTETVAAGWMMLPTDVFLTGLGQMLQQFAISLALGIGAGVVLGILIGVAPVLNQLFRYVLEFLRFTPSVVYIPILLLLMGARPPVAITLAAIGSTWPVLYQTYYGVVGVSPILKDTGRVFGLSRAQQIRSITIPSVSPFLATGIRIAAAHALIIVVAVQIIAAVPGTGRDIQNYAENGVFPRMYALILVVGIIGLIINGLLELLERRQLHWHASYREKQA
ncbi:ABC transporter permease subunit [Arthrobacter sp. CDRTa11]|uniref:ABC transporter permease n=1 Tax=Arthrobacter sp. CDRTa11 TaxID=2651199 RepID=UPI002265D3D2|nr:ABC transporter permease subunit [Arthrobacter sp. CDRTa11]UZX03112.1 ABC transporter permease subunit [Arthrobacter sp. CDRTa11]